MKSFMAMSNPPHPGEVVRSVLIEGKHLSVTEAAKMLGISRATMSKLLNCRAGISAEMAVRLSIALNTSSQMWINLQANYDLWQAEKGRNRLIKEMHLNGRRKAGAIRSRISRRKKSTHHDSRKSV